MSTSCCSACADKGNICMGMRIRARALLWACVILYSHVSWVPLRAHYVVCMCAGALAHHDAFVILAMSRACCLFVCLLVVLCAPSSWCLCPPIPHAPARMHAHIILAQGISNRVAGCTFLPLPFRAGLCLVHLLLRGITLPPLWRCRVVRCVLVACSGAACCFVGRFVLFSIRACHPCAVGDGFVWLLRGARCISGSLWGLRAPPADILRVGGCREFRLVCGWSGLGRIAWRLSVAVFICEVFVWECGKRFGECGLCGGLCLGGSGVELMALGGCARLTGWFLVAAGSGPGASALLSK